MVGLGLKASSGMIMDQSFSGQDMRGFGMAPSCLGFSNFDDLIGEGDFDDTSSCPVTECNGDEPPVTLRLKYLSPKVVDVMTTKLMIVLDPSKHMMVVFRIDQDPTNDGRSIEVTGVGSKKGRSVRPQNWA